jgi:hypothetical protein
VEKAGGEAAPWKDPDAVPVRAAIDRGLNFFLKEHRQNPSGAFGDKYPVAVSSLTGLAILGAGNHYAEEPYGQVLGRLLAFILRSSSEGAGYISDKDSRMHGHCYAVLFLTQIYGELPPRDQAEVREAINKGLEVIRSSQSSRGGWYYHYPKTTDEDEASITICALQALRAANGVGFVVPKTIIDDAVGYVKKCQVENGSFIYSLTSGGKHPTYGLTVAAISTLHAAGIYDSPEISRGLDFARRRLAEHPGDPLRAAEKEFFSYANLYAAQAFWQAGGETWAAWNQGARRYLLSRQGEDGSWSDDYGVEFGTAVAILMLEVHLNYLPLFQR